jgi:two-component system chemotaxis response regulator CheB
MAQDGTLLEQGTCYISSNEHTVRVRMNADGEACLSVEGRVEKPLDHLFESAAEVFKQNTVGLLLTGIGDDGANGFLKIKEKTGVTIAQSTDTCVYPNLTHNVIEKMAVDSVVDERELPRVIESAIK